MKKDIHPKYNKELKVTCSCGNSFVTGSTLDTDEITVELCSKCHPFYTGEQKLVESNVLKKFEERAQKSKKMSFQSKREKMEKRKAKKDSAPKPSSSLTLKDMLANANISK